MSPLEGDLVRTSTVPSLRQTQTGFYYCSLYREEVKTYGDGTEQINQSINQPKNKWNMSYSPDF